MSSLLPLRGDGIAFSKNENVKVLHHAHWLDGQVVFDRRLWQCESLQLEWRSKAHLIVFTERGQTVETKVSCNTGMTYSGRDKAGALSFIPASVERKALYRKADLIYCAFWIDSGLARHLSGWAVEKLQPLINVSDSVISTLISSLKQDIATQSIPDAEYIEHMAALCLHRVAVRGNQQRQRTSGRTLSNRQMREIEIFTDTYLNEKLSIDHLASVVGMNAETFSRIFTASAGKSPYEFIIEKRINKARTMIAESDESLSFIACACGFSSQSHFTSVFRTRVGVTPKIYRSLYSV